MVSGCVGVIGVFALTLGLRTAGRVGFVRKVSRIFQVASRPGFHPTPSRPRAVGCSAPLGGRDREGVPRWGRGLQGPQPSRSAAR
jgi:hypothetical protein